MFLLIVLLFNIVPPNSRFLIFSQNIHSFMTPGLHYGRLLACISLFLCTLGLNAQAKKPGDIKVSITENNISYEEIFNSLRKQTGIWFTYSNEDFNLTEKVAFSVKEETLDVALGVLSKRLGFTWSYHNKSVAIAKVVVVKDSTITVTGRITDEKGNPIIGASVLLKGTRTGAVTNQDGTFLVKAVKANGLLVVSSVGFLTKEVVVNNQQSVGQVQMKQYVGSLDEIQVQAYGTTSRRLSTGNISTVKADDIAKSPVANPLLAIAGRVPGVFIQQSSGVPGSGVKIIIQGQNSIGYGNDPFYVIDGVPFTSQLLPGLTNELGQSGAGTPVTPNTNGNPLNFINPQDIESIDILKDADATSIYGSRAANGAIIITTKKGKPGRTAVNLNVQQGWGKITRKLQLLNTSQYLEMRKEAFSNDNLPIPTVPTPGAFDLTFWDQHKYTDWQKVLIGGTSKYTNAIASVSGGSDRTQFLLSTGYQEEGTVTPGNLRDKKASVHLNINNTSENNRFKLLFSGSYVADDNKLALVSSMVDAAFTLPPNAPDLYHEGGSLNWELLASGLNSFTNPLTYLTTHYFNKTTNLIANATLGYQLIPGLELKSSLGYNKLLSDEVFGNGINQLPPFRKTFTPRRTEFNTASISSWIIEPQLTYNRKIGAGKFDALLGTTIQQENRNRQKLIGTGFTSDQTIFNIKAASSVIVDPSQDAVIISTYKYCALFGRLNYNINNKYILNLTARRDGSSRFGSQNRFHNFMSVGGAWLFSGEEFILSHLSWLSFGKIRASYGTTGNDQIGDYGYLNLYNNTPTGGVPYQGIIALQPSGDFPNPYLQWEETTKKSVTLDLGFFKDRILINATYYKNVCGNQLLFEPLVSITGGSSVRINLPAKVQNTGLEIGLNIRTVEKGNFTWLSNFNLTIPRNKFYEYTGVDGSRSKFNGRPLGVIQTYHFSGVDPTTGLYTFADKDGKPTSIPNTDKDRTTFIDLNPSFYGGIQNSISYKGLVLDFLFQFVKQQGVGAYFGSPIALVPGYNAFNQPITVLNRWQQPGDKANLQKYSTSLEVLNSYIIATQSDKYYSDASYIRLKNLSLSYTLPSVWLSKQKFKSARIYIQGQNLLTFTHYPGVDPENRLFNGLPPLKILTVGIQIGL
jgi:TonB-linked SusC/RagA family outer membrane protein